MLSVGICEVCSAPIQFVRGRGRPKMYCGVNCRAIGGRRKRKAAGRPYRRRKFERMCVVCGASWMASTADASICSNACKNVLRYPLDERKRRQERKQAQSAARKKLAAAARGTAGSTIWVAGGCVICRSTIVCRQEPQRAKIVCSVECRKIRNAEAARRHKAIRKAVKRGATRTEKVYRKRVFERDGYRCHLCRRLTDRTKAVPHPRAPTIDHVIPLAAGGTHEPSNCRTACFICNCRKSNRGGGEQLLLIG